MEARYQVVLLQPEPADPAASEVQAVLRATIERRVDDLGLDHATHITFLEASTVRNLDPRGPATAVYFGFTPADLQTIAAIDYLSARSIAILPLVPHIEGYTSQVPLQLKPINGVEAKTSDPAHDEIATRVLEELRLIRQRRAAFISYKRNESSGVAHQLFHRLAERAYRVFLDVHGVLGGEDVQGKLWDQMNDADILILLRTQTAFASDWVQLEIARAQNLGLGILQVLWPGTTSIVGATLADPVLLEEYDYDASDHMAAGGRLLPAALERLVNSAEVSRARSLAARRTRVVNEFQRAAEQRGFRVRIQPVGYVEAENSTTRVTVFPIVGHPDTTAIHDAAETALPAAPGVSTRRAILYDSLGIWQQRTQHLSWLNRHLPVPAVATVDVESLL